MTRPSAGDFESSGGLTKSTAWRFLDPETYQKHTVKEGLGHG
jgi:hypothetical protein